MKLTNGRFGRIYTLNSHTFDYIVSEQAAYWLGFLYADGTTFRNSLLVRLKASDLKHLDRLSDFMESDRRARECLNRANGITYPSCTIEFTDAHLVERIHELGITKGRKEFNKCIEQIPEYLNQHFIRGLFDGDGSAFTRPGMNWLGSRDLVYFVRETLAQEVGTNPNLKLIQHQKARSVWYVIYVGRPQCLRIAAYLYRDATIWLPRKRQRIEAWPERKPVARDSKTGRWLPFRS